MWHKAWQKKKKGVWTWRRRNVPKVLLTFTFCLSFIAFCLPLLPSFHLYFLLSFAAFFALFAVSSNSLICYFVRFSSSLIFLLSYLHFSSSPIFLSVNLPHFLCFILFSASSSIFIPFLFNIVNVPLFFFFHRTSFMPFSLSILPLFSFITLSLPYFSSL